MDTPRNELRARLKDALASLWPGSEVDKAVDAIDALIEAHLQANKRGDT